MFEDFGFQLSLFFEKETDRNYQKTNDRCSCSIFKIVLSEYLFNFTHWALSGKRKLSRINLNNWFRPSTFIFDRRKIMMVDYNRYLKILSDYLSDFCSIKFQKVALFRNSIVEQNFSFSWLFPSESSWKIPENVNFTVLTDFQKHYSVNSKLILLIENFEIVLKSDVVEHILAKCFWWKLNGRKHNVWWIN